MTEVRKVLPKWQYFVFIKWQDSIASWLKTDDIQYFKIHEDIYKSVHPPQFHSSIEIETKRV
jgi:hypothetical protein